MKDQAKTKQQLITELAEMRRRLSDLEEAGKGQIESSGSVISINVTDRNHAEAAIRRSEAQYRRLYESMRDAFVSVSMDGRIQEYNEAYRQMLGYGPEELAALTFRDLTPSKWHAFQDEIIEKQVLMRGYSDLYEKEYRRKDGTVVPVELRTKLLRDDSGKPCGMWAILRDITERKRTEEALRQSEQRMSLHVQQTPLGVIEWDVEGKVTQWNPGAERIFGYTEDEALGRHVAFIVAPVAREHADRVWDDLIARKGGERSTNENVTKDGRLILCEWYNTPLVDAEGRVVGVASLVEDITERKRNETALRESEERYRELADSTTDVIYILDKTGKLLYANRTAGGYFGVSPESLVGKTQQDLFPTEQVPFHLEHLRKVIERGQMAEMDGLYRFGAEEVWLNVRTIPLRDEQGRITSVMGVCRNITAQKRAEEALQRAYDELEQKVKERTAELQKANEELDIFRRFAEASGQGFGMADMDGLVTYLNPALCRLVGVAKPEDVIGKHLTTYYPEGYLLRRETEILPALIHEGHWQGELVGSLGGETVYVLQNSFLIKDENGNPSRLASVITDITEHKRAEAALRASEEKYRTLVEASPDGVIMADLHGHITFASGRVLEIYGTDRAEDLLRRNPLEFVSPADHQRFLANLRRSVDEGIVRNIEYSLLRKDGTTFAGELSTAVVRDVSGQPMALVAILKDITERKRAEEALRASEARFRSYFEQGLIGMAVSTPDRQWTQVNDRLCEILGYSRNELLEMKWTDLTHPDDLDRNLALQDRVRAGESDYYTLDKRFLRKDGRVVDAAVFVRYFRRPDESLDHSLALIEDMTERKQAQEALLASEERFRAAFEEAPVGMVISSADGVVVKVNRALCKMSGFSPEEIVGHHTREFSHPEDTETTASLAGKLFSGEVPSFTVQKRYLKKNGGFLWAEMTAAGIREPGGKVPFGLAIVEDITDRKRAEEALERERQSLWRMLQASDHERQIISYDIHDGLAQYLAGAGMQFQAHDALKENSPEEAKTAYQTAVELVRQAHLEARRLINEVRPPVIDENGIETAISHLVHEQRRRGGPQIECRSDVRFGRLALILENALYRIAQEALSNACKHSRSKNVTVSLTQEGQEAWLKVQDWGIGFDPEAVGKGHFGLEGIRQRVRLLGGRLTIESTPGSGTLVQVVVPILEQQADR